MSLKNTALVALALALSTLSWSASAQAVVDKAPEAEASMLGDGFWRLMASPYTIHWGSDPEGLHEPVYMIGVERQRMDGWLLGATYFSNSFGQPSAYVYVGEKITNFSPIDSLFFQWTAGILYGYKYPYEHKVPFNHNGVSPGATISLGWQFTRNFSAQAIALGTAGMMFQLAWEFR